MLLVCLNNRLTNKNSVVLLFILCICQKGLGFTLYSTVINVFSLINLSMYDTYIDLV